MHGVPRAQSRNPTPAMTWSSSACCGEASAGLPEGVVIADESHQIAPNFATVQGTIALCLEPVEQGLRTLPPGRTSRSGALSGSAKTPSAKRKSSTESKPKKTVISFSRRGGVLADIPVVNIVRGRGYLAEQEEAAFTEAVGVLADVRAKPRAGQRPHVLYSVDTKAVDVDLANPVGVCLDEGIDDVGADRVVVVGVVLERRYVPELVFRGRVEVAYLSPRRWYQSGFLNSVGTGRSDRRNPPNPNCWLLQ